MRFSLVVVLLGPSLALAGQGTWKDFITLSGTVSSDVRVNLENYRGAISGQGYDVAVNRNDVTLHAEVTPDERVVAVLDTRLRYYGLTDANTLPQLSNRDRVDPFSVQLDQAYVAVRGVPFSFLDLKVGRMVQTWGSADLFNQVDTLNARDFFDPMDYSRKVPNQMVELDLYAGEHLTLKGVWVPAFKPSQLPPSASLGFAVTRDAQGCVTGMPAPPLDHAQAKQLADTFASINPCALNLADPEVRTVLPANGLKDSQAALRAELKLDGLDVALSYAFTRFTFPVAYTAVAKANVSTTSPGKVDVAYVAEVMYPRMQVLGLDFSSSLPFLDHVGVVGELAVIFPEQVIFGLRAYQGPAKLLELSSVNVASDPFVKATLGLDYTFTKWLYANAMYVHGFFDEFADRYGVHDYAVGAAELKFRADTLVLRLSGVLNVNDGSSVLNPQVTWVVVPGVEAIGGVFVFGGSPTPKDPLDYAARSKFGQRAAGRSQGFFKLRFTW